MYGRRCECLRVVALVDRGDHLREPDTVPPYIPVTSKAQSRKLFALAAAGKISDADARGKTRAADFDRLPSRVSDSKRGKRAKGRPRPVRPALRRVSR